MKADYRRDTEGRVDINLIAETDIEKIELKYFQETFRTELIGAEGHKIRDFLGRYFIDAGGSSDEEGVKSLTLRSYPKDDKYAQLGIMFKLRNLNGVFSYFSRNKIKRRKEA